MLGFCSRRLQLLFPSRSNAYITRLYSSKSSLETTQDDKDCSFTVSYLVNSCGLSSEQSLSLFKRGRIQFDSPRRPDSVVKLFKDHAFEGTHIAELVRKLPELLVVNAEKTLLPKLEFFNSVGITGTTLAEVVSGNPLVFWLSLENNIRPCYDIIKSIGIPDGKVPRFIMKAQRMFTVNFLSNAARNVSFLRSIKVRQATLNFCRPETLHTMTSNINEFDENVNKVISMGFSPSSAMFVKALYVVSVMDDAKLTQRMEFYEKRGWTEEDILLAISKNPPFRGCLVPQTVLTRTNSLINLGLCISGLFYVNPNPCLATKTSFHSRLLVNRTKSKNNPPEKSQRSATSHIELLHLQINFY